MKRPLLLILIAFLSGCIAGYAGIVIALHHTQEPLAQSVHFAWYDWFMYIAWPGFTLAGCFFDPMNPASKSFCVPAIALANGLLASLAFISLFLVSHLVNMVCRKMWREPLTP
jgi:hypothetical protein